MTSQSPGEKFDHLYRYPTSLERFMSGLSALNFNAVKLLVRSGKSSAFDYLAQSHRLFSGFGRPGHSVRPPWCKDTIPGKSASEIFPEIDFDSVDAMRGMDISITTTAKTDEEAKALLEAFSFPFRN